MISFTTQEKNALNLFSPGFGGTKVPEWLKKFLDNGLGGVTLFGSNTPDLETTNNLVAQLRIYNPDLIVSIDEEGGDVTRLFAREGSPIPSAALLGKINNLEFTEKCFLNLGNILKSLDIDMTFAPVADVVSSPKNPILGVRSFGIDTDLVCEHIAAAVTGLKKAKVSSSLKHFPGHGGAIEDSHHSLPRVRETYEILEEIHLKPFLSGITAGADSIMVGHLVIESLDAKNAASQSKIVMNEFLRNKIGYQGVIITDALDMGALGGAASISQSAVNAISTGADFLCFSGLSEQEEFVSTSINHVTKAISAGLIDESEIAESSLRIAHLRDQTKQTIKAKNINSDELTSGFEIYGNPKIKSKSIKYSQLSGEPTIAAGHINWGLKNALLSKELNVLEVDHFEDVEIVVFRDAWRDRKMYSQITKIKEFNPDCIFIDMGWPTLEFNPKNLIRTFGVGAITSEAVVSLLLA